MRAHLGVLAAVLALSLGACSDDSDDSSDSGPRSVSTSDIGSPSGTTDPSVTELTVDCPKFEKAARKIAEAQAALYDPNGDADQAIEDLLAELDTLKEGAPDDVDQALTDLGAGFQDAAELLKDPTQANQAKLVVLAPRLADDGQKVTDYITEQCGS